MQARRVRRQTKKIINRNNKKPTTNHLTIRPQQHNPGEELPAGCTHVIVADGARSLPLRAYYAAAVPGVWVVRCSIYAFTTHVTHQHVSLHTSMHLHATSPSPRDYAAAELDVWVVRCCPHFTHVFRPASIHVPSHLPSSTPSHTFLFTPLFTLSHFSISARTSTSTPPCTPPCTSPFTPACTPH